MGTRIRITLLTAAAALAGSLALTAAAEAVGPAPPIDAVAIFGIGPGQ